MKNKINSFVLTTITTFILLATSSSSFADTEEDANPVIQKTEDDIVENKAFSEMMGKISDGLIISHIKRGDEFFKKGMYEEALKHYVIETEITLAHSEPYYKKAKCLEKMGKDQEAKEALKIAKRIDKIS